MTWLADWEPSTCAVVAGAIIRAHEGVTLSPDQLQIVLDALRDARDHYVRKMIGCAACDDAERAGQRACARHLADDDMADKYTGLGELLGGEVTS
jgi:hypothetical protein